MKTKSFEPVMQNMNFPEMEKRILASWYKDGIVDKYLHRNDAASKRFSFLDGPITANNPMGVHHAWGRTYKDLWQRFYTLRGYKERFQNGFDCQGLWVEVEVEKELGIRNKRDIENLVLGDKKASIAKFVELCKERVRKFSSMQTEQSKRLGYIVDWNNSYYTMSDENNYMIWYFLRVCFEKGWIYKGRDSVPWCPRCETAISQHEMLTEDYKELTHDSIIIEYPIVGQKNTYLLVWTTTPWTLPGNVAVAADPNKEYVKAEGDDAGNTYILIKKAAERLKLKVKQIISGKELIGLQYTSPFDYLPRIKKAFGKYEHRVVASDPLLLPVSEEEGTGMVHIAPGQGSEDYQLGRKEKLPIVELIDDQASYLDEMEEFSRQNAKKHPEMIIDFLKKNNSLFLTQKYTHRYPACWRCKTELVWKVADEWYIAMDKKEGKNGKTLREQMMDTARQITWLPAFGLDRELDWLSNMHDWLISKPNRYWGLALPIYECKKCGWFTVIGSKEELKKKAVSGWSEFEGHSPHKPFIDEVKIACEKCGETVSRLNDVGNVWLDAGIVGFSTLIDPKTKKLSYTSDKKYWSEWYPADFITESFPGQFKNWFYSMIAMSTVLEKKTCFKSVLGYGSMLGEDGRPMHKSWGNSIEFNEGADKIGVDVMRWMFAKHNPEQNLLFGYKLADETRRKFHLLLWNVYNFFVTYANIDGWQPSEMKSKKTVLDEWITGKFNRIIDVTTKSLEAHDAATAANAIEGFVTDLSQWYVRRSRDRVGPAAENGNSKSAFYETTYDVLTTLSKIIAPFLPFLADELYTHLTGEESVHLSNWPDAIAAGDMKLDDEMNIARQAVELAHAKRKEGKLKVRVPLASLVITAPVAISEQVLDIVRDEVNVKKATYKKGSELGIALDTVITPELAAEGRARELVRQIQMLRKEKGCTIDQRIEVFLPKEYNNLSNDLIAYIGKETLATAVTWGDTLNISIG